ncbi:hypothetical protein RJZ56_007616 [Blastomyces dermatitidis]|uniref:Uncharacterized protein n=3 Tax=Blastomyces TaxID=229219 RepID=A0A179U785_BLAGS|nr:uncharacterized protein BDBG_16118 [Blastomyces gilchristii SLH14081]XP_045282767.1 uncharacterized protein BDCG_17907 [Blastomyces dermatitidis ER-3]KMW68014.1 hypothetical protein BDDG_12520 [Blastomyces dermatitidis ATCC 18188]OAT03040.1 hypothetical protein BDCG_17907 [Blastomyces dermatitidis ER-3]OAT03834.1 hypothetical protein BDBG_16118 [Blastomyces gilchristii SLH14081]
MPDRIASIPSPQINRSIAPAALPDSGAEKGLNPPQATANGNLEKNAPGLTSTQSSSPAGRHNKEEAEEVLQYHYLTFGTSLPPPTGISSPTSPGQQAAPEQPDLRPFISPFTWRNSR